MKHAALTPAQRAQIAREVDMAIAAHKAEREAVRILRRPPPAYTLTDMGRTHRKHRAAGLCVLCREPNPKAGVASRCDGCREKLNAAYRPAGETKRVFHCGACRGTGHTRATCDANVKRLRGRAEVAA